VSRLQLEPGTYVDPPEVDDTWLTQKHRDIIRDYSDVSQDEKEFIWEYDAFIMKERVTSEPHLQEAYLKFVEAKAQWLHARQSRMTEFAKHMTYLAARNSLHDETIAEAAQILRRAKSEIRNRPADDKTPSPRTENFKSASGCTVCGLSVRGPSLLLCANTVSETRHRPLL
jgi:hypothetical protein